MMSRSMKKAKIFVLEMCSGLFECIWIGAGFIAKPIAVALDSAGRRLDYISQLVERGYDQVAADVAWRSADDGGTNLLRNLRQAEIGAEIFRPESVISLANSRRSVD